jgi:twitching motility protein PilJ
MRITSFLAAILLALLSGPLVAKWDQESRASDLLSRIQMRVEHLPLVASEAAGGNPDAFVVLKQSRDEIDGMLQRLKQGDPRNGMSGYSDQDSFKNDLASLDATWTKLNARVATLLEAKQQIIEAKAAADEFAAKLAALNTRTEETVKILLDKDGSKNQLYITMRQMLVADRMGRRSQSIIRGGEEAETATAGLQRDALYYGAMLAGLVQGNPNLNIKAVANANARAILSDINQQWTTAVAPLAGKLLETGPAVQAARSAADEITIDSQTFVLNADPLSRHLHD